MMSILQHIQEAAEYIRKKHPNNLDIGLILGSGLGVYADAFPEPLVLPYEEIPHFPASTVVGHKGQLVIQQFGDKAVLAMQGRFHYYEGYSMEQITFPVRVMSALGVRRLIATNAAGGINPAFEAGSLMAITDHINFMGDNPLIGPHAEDFGDRFPDMTQVYCQDGIQIFDAIAKRLDVQLHHGVYMAFSGPSYETPAEIRMARTMGADAVGMSTVPEAIVARQAGINVSGISCITNPAAGMGPPLTHAEVIESTQQAQKKFIALIDGVVRELL
ncbi:purine-nucleoside phosphorylase [candidate division KSB3 bacterium]|uniref:Purine nucleoside phosphorylase n=1 Tax=candidate division KSB3 bacterium TaxID=2044937 RepID=A0A2G6KD62_9BACT|nr:MAG: purine-nucleoside phosphorylase [candidate division KSB3 bacterium]